MTHQRLASHEHRQEAKPATVLTARSDRGGRSWPGRFLGGKAVAAATLSDAGRIPEMAGAKHRFFEDRFRPARIRDSIR
jgi:hypothetical protein